METVRKRTCQERFELRLTTEELKKLRWLKARLARSATYIIREGIEARYEEERRVMLIQAGFPDGKVPS